MAHTAVCRTCDYVRRKGSDERVKSTSMPYEYGSHIGRHVIARAGTSAGHVSETLLGLRKVTAQFESPPQIESLHFEKGAGPSDPRTRAPCSRGRIRAALARGFQEHQARAPESASLLHTEGLKTSSEPRAARAASCRARVAAAQSPSRTSHTACGQPEASPCVCCACTRDASAHFR